MRRPLSLRARLLWASVAVLLGFVVLTAAALDRAFRNSANAAQAERLEALVYLLMGTVDIAADGPPRMPAVLPEGRLAVPGSGLYAAIARAEPAGRWESDSGLGLAIPFEDALTPGERRNAVRTDPDGNPFRVISQGVLWTVGGPATVVTFSVAAPLAAQQAEVSAYRQSLWTALALMAVLMVATLVAVQQWGLRPLRSLARGLAALEAGEARELAGRHPAEIAPLAENLNRLLARERSHLERYRAALGDLAHSLKTPLAVLRGVASSEPLPPIVDEQLQRMDQIVAYQLQRAATAGASQTAAPLVLAPLVERLFATVHKVHAGRVLVLEHGIPAGLAARLDEGDALELLGNLIDNACKWAAGRVAVEARRGEGGLVVAVEDDGPGIGEPDRVLRRGGRGDEHTPGHGLGLAIVQDIALAYRGDVRIERGERGGARVVVRLEQA